MLKVLFPWRSPPGWRVAGVPVGYLRECSGEHRSNFRGCECSISSDGDWCAYVWEPPGYIRGTQSDPVIARGEVVSGMKELCDARAHVFGWYLL